MDTREKRTPVSFRGEATAAPRAALAAAAFLVSAIALVNPALADECGDTADIIRDAADGRNFSGAGLRQIDIAIDKAVLRLNLGDDRGCLSELAIMRETLLGS